MRYDYHSKHIFDKFFNYKMSTLSPEIMDGIYLQILQHAIPDMSGNFYTSPNFPDRKFQGNVARIMLETWSDSTDDIVQAVIQYLNNPEAPNPIYDYYLGHATKIPESSIDLIIDVFKVYNQFSVHIGFEFKKKVGNSRKRMLEDAEEYQAKRRVEALTIGTSSYPISETEITEVKLNRFPVNLVHFSDLTFLNLNHGTITTIPDAIGQLTQLMRLNLSHNHIIKISPAIENLSELQYLDLSHNLIYELPESMSNLRQLLTMKLQDNKLSTLPAISSLNYLDLKDNIFVEIPDSLRISLDLRTLLLDNNQLREIPDWLSELIRLETLNLGNNNIKYIDTDLGNLQNLQTLNLASNPLISLPNSILELSNLRELKIRQTRIDPEILEILQINLPKLKIN